MDYRIGYKIIGTGDTAEVWIVYLKPGIFPDDDDYFDPEVQIVPLQVMERVMRDLFTGDDGEYAIQGDQK